MRRESQEGGCCCGAIRYEVRGAPRQVTHCHCLDCRRTSGALFVTWAEYLTAELRFTRGKPVAFSSRPGVTRQLCGVCGTQLTFHDRDKSEATDVTIGSLDDPEGVPPRDHVWSHRKPSWLRVDEHLPRYDESRAGGPKSEDGT